MISTHGSREIRVAKFIPFWPLYLYLATNAVGAWMFFEVVSDPLRIYQFNRNVVLISERVADAREMFWAFFEMFK